MPHKKLSLGEVNRLTSKLCDELGNVQTILDELLDYDPESELINELQDQHLVIHRYIKRLLSLASQAAA